ncbi:hypothetical protein BCV70DRAFT_235498 [Testicularia cyperi]|uniref:chitin synthase n=1 Tax=Testicularia cyperi TaxID=1882483 RepID=A0A317XV87_9BASI|nr:hypothetical protein BCV70DRAFT_235498 [Testicularia cyperi]
MRPDPYTHFERKRPRRLRLGSVSQPTIIPDSPRRKLKDREFGPNGAIAFRNYFSLRAAIISCRAIQAPKPATVQGDDEDPFDDKHAVEPTETTQTKAENPFQDPPLPLRDATDLEKGPIDASAPQFLDYVPLAPGFVTTGRWLLIAFIGACNVALVMVLFLAAPSSFSIALMVALKSRDDVLDTVDSIITDNRLRECDFNIICIVADGFDVEDEVIVQESLLKVDESPYISWKIGESAFRLHFGKRMGHPIVIVRKVKNAGKKDSLIFAFDLFNSDNEATGHLNLEARSLIVSHIRTLYDQPTLDSFDYVFCTDADTKILSGSLSALVERLDRESQNTIGACGLVEADFFKPDRSWRTCGLWYFWDHFQGYQYTFGQWVRRRSESSWGRVTCMPGAITLLRTGTILGQASAEYRSHIQNRNLLFRQVQYQGTDRRLCWTIISRSKQVRTVLETRAACFTIPPQSLSHYLSQRRRWGSNAYFNAVVTLTQPNQHIITRIWMTLEIARSTLVFFRIFNLAHFVWNLVVKFDIVALAPMLAVALLPQIWFLLFVGLGQKRYRAQFHHLLYGLFLNRVFSVVLTPTVYARVLLGFGDFSWGKSHTGANAATKAAEAGAGSAEPFDPTVAAATDDEIADAQSLRRNRYSRDSIGEVM